MAHCYEQNPYTDKEVDIDISMESSLDEMQSNMDDDTTLPSYR